MNKSAQKKLALFEQLNADFENKLFTYRQSMDRYALSQSNPTATATMRERTKKNFGCVFTDTKILFFGQFCYRGYTAKKIFF